MTADEPEIVPQGVADADQERWLTYLNYDQSVKQAVRRLGALSAENVELFRSLLMQGRDRSRVSEFEAESVRRLQGEAFVGDEELQRTLIVLHAEDPHLAEEFKRVVAATGKPQELDQTIAAIRAQKDAPPGKIKLVETPRPKLEIPQPEIPKPEIPKPQILSPEIPAPTPRIKEAPTFKAPEPAAKDIPAEPAPPQAPSYRKLRAAAPAAVQPAERRSWKGPLSIAAALLVVVLAGLAILWPRPQESATQLAAAPQAVAPQPVAPPSQSSPAAPSGPAQTQAANQTPAAAPGADVAMPAQNNGKIADGKNPPEIRPASDATDRIASGRIASQAAPANAPPTPAPVPGAYYKVVRGDMLSEIAVRAYRDASKFPIIQRANPSLRASADRILVDQVIFIPRAP